MAHPTSTTVTVLTPPGRGAIATIAIDGPRAVDVVEQLFDAASGRSLISSRTGRIVFGRWQTGEELVVCRLAADKMEVHCHGGSAAVEAIVSSLAQLGAVWQDAEQYLAKYATDEIQAEASLALTQAKTERTALILLDQYHGALRRELDSLADLKRNDSEAARKGAAQLLSTAKLGLHLTRPWRVAIAGRPNAGKSSLMNALLGFQRSIVFEQPGTTRDAVTAQTALNGWPVELIDTAGLRDTVDEVESQGIQIAREQLAEADLVLHVHDVTQPWHPLGSLLEEDAKAVMVVCNKCDLPAAKEAGGIRIIARTGEGLSDLIAAIVHQFVPQPPVPGAAMLFTSRQIAALTLEYDLEIDATNSIARETLKPKM